MLQRHVNSPLGVCAKRAVRHTTLLNNIVELSLANKRRCMVRPHFGDVLSPILRNHFINGLHDFLWIKFVFGKLFNDFSVASV